MNPVFVGLTDDVIKKIITLPYELLAKQIEEEKNIKIELNLKLRKKEDQGA